MMSTSGLFSFSRALKSRMSWVLVLTWVLGCFFYEVAFAITVHRAGSGGNQNREVYMVTESYSAQTKGGAAPVSEPLGGNEISEDPTFGSGQDLYFATKASNLTSDHLSFWDIIWHRISSRANTHVTINTDGDAANGDSRNPDGFIRGVVYQSSATDLTNDPPFGTQIFVFDKNTGNHLIRLPNGNQITGSHPKIANLGNGIFGIVFLSSDFISGYPSGSKAVFLEVDANANYQATSLRVIGGINAAGATPNFDIVKKSSGDVWIAFGHTKCAFSGNVVCLEGTLKLYLYVWDGVSEIISDLSLAGATYPGILATNPRIRGNRIAFSEAGDLDDFDWNGEIDTYFWDSGSLSRPLNYEGDSFFTSGSTQGHALQVNGYVLVTDSQESLSGLQGTHLQIVEVKNNGARQLISKDNNNEEGNGDSTQVAAFNNGPIAFQSIANLLLGSTPLSHPQIYLSVRQGGGAVIVYIQRVQGNYQPATPIFRSMPAQTPIRRGP